MKQEIKIYQEQVTRLSVKDIRYVENISFTKETIKIISKLSANVKNFIVANENLIQYGSVSDTF